MRLCRLQWFSRRVSGSFRLSNASHGACQRGWIGRGGMNGEPRRHHPFSTASGGSDKVERFRVAIVGGGAAGLSTALHFAPLAAAGYIQGPIDLFEAVPLSAEAAGGQKTTPPSPGSGPFGRPVGVGVWNTALEPFAMSERQTHLDLVKQLEHDGRWVGRVGYRTPDGHWLARSELDTSLLSSGDPPRPGARQPGLLFLREVDLLSALRSAVRTEEEQHATIQTHYGPDYAVQEIVTNANIHPASGRLVFGNGSLSPRSYHMIVAAGGMNSKLRSLYAGHCFKRRRGRSRPSGMALGSDREPDPYFDRQKLAAPEQHAKEEDEWDNYSHYESNAVEDRQYTVFRGNAPLTDAQVAPQGGGPPINFQTWGTGSCMRFASVGMSRPAASADGRLEEQVWFATTSDPRIGLAADAQGRKDLLKRAFSGWHDPIARLIAATPPDQIYVHRAVAHKHSVRPVLDLAEVLAFERKRRQERQGRSPSDLRRSRAFRQWEEGETEGAAKRLGGAGGSITTTTGGTAATGDGPGPVLVFVGDSSLTIDPVLAQGFTVAMEAAADLALTIERSCDQSLDTSCNFDPRALRDELVSRHDRRYRRLLCLLRATELVQALAQPHSGSPMGWFSRGVIRPAMWATPQWMKRPIFDAMIRYSLGLWESNPTSLAFVPPANPKTTHKDKDNGSEPRNEDGPLLQ